MTTPLLIRRAEPADAEAILRILGETYEATWKPELSAEAIARFESSAHTALYVRERLAYFEVACIAGEVVGLLDWRDDFIDALHVSPRHQRLGIGAALLRHAETVIANAGHARIRLETDTFNQQARAFYGKHGYAEVDMYPDEEWHSGFTTVLMSKGL
ncbi:GNAT family N-acetyltransferase [Pseudomonas sp. BGr12]|uniref:GNAT family N-acetyltransferase n=1 Tax=unclassified Pseudomonas TaxID=196821 RepID=UPI00177D2CC0|nr:MULTISPECIES: GNAT family N-acetyltransferase [unclassified Pseudomonas]MBD9501969.1 GNAT family N-acetyltransferase [Pseudomonas sp. PDM17]MBD9579546.1 GNAT family N-acetyltransferase [Pseudomonas sp. PDM23]MBD9674799.1 GNAT family N-acetyltransferase [Pseudomonas sp. PDM21]MDL2431289.1 GNAT family N-acetyltransferase [Pseudomonas sp. BJa5]